MLALSDTHQRRNIPKSFPQKMVSEVLMVRHKHNKSEAVSMVEALIPKTSLPEFDPKRLETFSLEDFVELLEAAGSMPTGNEKVLTVEESATAPIQNDVGCIDRIRKSRFRFLVEHLYSGEQLIRDLPLKENLNDALRLLHVSAVDGLINFLTMTHDLFYHVLALKRGEGYVGRSKVPIAEPNQDLYTYFVRREPAAWSVDSDGRLASQRFPEIDPSRGLVERLLELLNRADPARIRQCAFRNCGKCFYAKRIDQVCCSRRCNNNRLQLEWYEKHGKSAVYIRASRGENKR